MEKSVWVSISKCPNWKQLKKPGSTLKSVNKLKILALNTSWMKKLSLFGGNWKLLIFKICIGINDHTHKDPKNQVDMIFQLFVYILQQNKWNLLKKQVL